MNQCSMQLVRHAGYERLSQAGTVCFALPRRLAFASTETGGPIVVPPTRRGFGTVILLDAAKKFAPTVNLKYEPEGVRYELRAPLSAIAADGKQTAA